VDTSGPEKRIVRVTIFQQPYSLRTSGDPAETEALAHGVDDLMHQIADRSASGDPARVAVMAALHLADKARTLEARAAELEARLNDCKQHLLRAGERAESAEDALAKLKQANREIEVKASGALDQRTASLYDRLATLDERLAALLDNRAF